MSGAIHTLSICASYNHLAICNQPITLTCKKKMITLTITLRKDAIRQYRPRKNHSARKILLPNTGYLPAKLNITVATSSHQQTCCKKYKCKSHGTSNDAKLAKTV